MKASTRRNFIHGLSGAVFGDYHENIKEELRRHESPSGEVRTLKDMSREEIKKLEKTYEARVLG